MMVQNRQHRWYDAELARMTLHVANANAALRPAPGAVDPYPLTVAASFGFCLLAVLNIVV